ncbi:MAG: (Fe-S)-binding protein [Firmicutes bacterium]|nr:(Fe-S)-binding protein [Bacillota bacterium]
MEKSKLSNSAIETVKDTEKNCIGCKLCMEHCPMLNKFCSSPKELLKNIVKGEEVDPSIPYSCTLCNYCNAVCPNDVSLKNAFLDMRKDLFSREKSKIKELGYNTVKNHQKNSFSKIFSTSIKGFEDEKVHRKRRVFFPGCSLSSYSPDIVLRTYDYLKEKLPEVGIMQNCCGKPTYSMGDMEQFKEYNKKLEKEFSDNNIDEIIVACQNCFKTFEVSSNVKVTSLWEIISNYGIPNEVRGIGKGIDLSFAIHDPCPTRYERIIHDSIRDITNQLGLKIKEMEFSREKTLCCGSGGMLNVTNNSLAQSQMKKRANQADTDHILSYCEECVESMKRGGKQSFHILDLLFDTHIYSTFTQKDQGTIKKWINRYKSKQKINKIK